jgi:hypothetical protein
MDSKTFGVIKHLMKHVSEPSGLPEDSEPSGLPEDSDDSE